MSQSKQKLKKAKEKTYFREICAKKVRYIMGNAIKGHNKTGCDKVAAPKRRAFFETVK